MSNGWFYVTSYLVTSAAWFLAGVYAQKTWETLFHKERARV